MQKTRASNRQHNDLPASNDHDLVIGAHYDSMFNTVGAHDNASGTAAFLSVAIFKPKGELCELTQQKLVLSPL